MKATLISAILAAAPTPEATHITAIEPSPEILSRGFAAHLRPNSPRRIGVMVICNPRTGQATAVLNFGTFPPDKPVQAAVRTASGSVERFGPVHVTEHGARAGPHFQQVGQPDRIRTLVDVAFRSGSLISNGHNSVWNRIPEPENTAARAALLACVGRPAGAHSPLTTN